MANPDLLTKIREELPNLSKNRRRIALYILDHYDKAAYLTAARFGTIVGVSESTVVRFALDIGYSGYPALQQALRELIRTKLTAVQRMDITNDRIGDADVLDSVLHRDMEKIKETLENVSRDDFNRAVDRIIGADMIYILGVRNSASLAMLLNFNFNLIFRNVKLLRTSSGSEIFEQLLHAGPNDVMIAISFPRYSNRVIHAVEYAGRTGIPVISITDSEYSPIAAGADCLLTAKSDIVSFSDSLVAPMSLINALIVAITKKKQDELATTFEQLEHIWNDYNVYTPTGENDAEGENPTA